ncbi:MAG: pre-16S rRNA-processing nuclease YqgF [Armatimonadota bacterium]|nr:pre-16S rRNA-processing nuclease YqgF [Armatimonadota bacterium]
MQGGDTIRYLAIDPGSHKVGIAIAERTAERWQVLFRAIVPLEQLRTTLEQAIAQYAPQRYLVGAGTGVKRLLPHLQTWFPYVSWELVPERDTTLQARCLYFEQHPPRGWRRLLPKGMRVPPEPYDDYAALALIYRVASET